MTQIAENEFTLYEMSEDETIFASTFSELQIKYIRSCRARFAIEKCNLAPTAEQSPEDFVRRHEYLRGGMAAFDLLLQSHEINYTHREFLDATATARASAVSSPSFPDFSEQDVKTEKF